MDAFNIREMHEASLGVTPEEQAQYDRAKAAMAPDVNYATPPGAPAPLAENEDLEFRGLRHLSKFTYPTRPTNAIYTTRQQVAFESTRARAAAATETRPAEAPSAIEPAAEALASTLTSDPARRKGLTAVITNFVRGGLGFTTDADEVQAQTITSLEATMPPFLSAPKGPSLPSQRVLELQNFLTYFYHELGGMDYRPADDVSYYSNEILVNNEYYGAMIAAYRRMRFYAMGKELPDLESIARDPDSVLYDAFVFLAAACCETTHVRSKDLDKARFGITVRDSRAQRDMRYAEEFAKGSVDIYLGRNRGDWSMQLLRPRV